MSFDPEEINLQAQNLLVEGLPLTKHNQEWFDTDVPKGIGDNSYRLFIAYADFGKGEPEIGAAALVDQRESDKITLELIAIKPELRGNGISSVMLKTVAAAYQPNPVYICAPVTMRSVFEPVFSYGSFQRSNGAIHTIKGSKEMVAFDYYRSMPPHGYDTITSMNQLLGDESDPIGIAQIIERHKYQVRELQCLCGAEVELIEHSTHVATKISQYIDAVHMLRAEPPELHQAFHQH